MTEPLTNTRRFWIVDAFSGEPLRGNPAAVVLDAEGLTDSAMQRIAAEFNLSETVFVFAPLDPEADYRARIFTPRAELPFAGHPTLAAAFSVHRSAWLGAETPGRLRQECGIGIVPIEIDAAGDHPVYTMTQAPPEHRPAGLEPEELASLLGCGKHEVSDTPIEIVSTGAPWCVAGIRSRRAIEALDPDLPAIARWSEGAGCEGITVFCDEAADPASRLRLRTFAPRHGIQEDPVCGSGNGAVGAYLAAHHADFRSPFHYRAEQGVEMGRAGAAFVSVREDGGGLRVDVGGTAARFAEGTLAL